MSVFLRTIPGFSPHLPQTPGGTSREGYPLELSETRQIARDEATFSSQARMYLSQTNRVSNYDLHPNPWRRMIMRMNALRTRLLAFPLALMVSAMPLAAQHHDQFNNGVRNGGRNGNYYDSRHDYQHDNHRDDHRNSGGIGPGKGALIGGAGGAALGAVFGKSLKGTLIGGAAGAGVGAIAGQVNQNNRDNNRNHHHR
jgi:hypothetical protein